MIDEIKLKLIHKAILSAKNIVVAIHANPDGDAWGSLAAMSLILQLLDKRFILFSQHAPTNKFSNLPNVVKSINDKQLLLGEEVDLWLSLDCGAVVRTGLVEEITRRSLGQLFIELDHHPAVEAVSDLSYRDTTAAATCEVLYYYICANQLQWTPEIATCLLVGLVTDTGNFLYPSTSAATMAVAADLLARGGRLELAHKSGWQNKTVAVMKLWGLALARLKVNPAGLAVTYLLAVDFAEAAVTDDELDDLSGFLASLTESWGLLLLRDSLATVKGSWRAIAPEADVAKLARLYGGGGHVKAAGSSWMGQLVVENGRLVIKNGDKSLTWL